MRDVLKMTMPQIILMTHASHINSVRIDNRTSRNDYSSSYNNNYQSGDYAGLDQDFEDMVRGQGSGKKREYNAEIARQHDSSKFVGNDPQISRDKKLSDVASDFEQLARYLGSWEA